MPTAGTSYGFVIDNRRCIGCHACTVACKAEHHDPIGVNKTWVSYIEKGVFPDVSRGFHVMRCNHCADAPCVEICPTACLETRADGIVDFDPGRCIGCKACMQACPYDAITIDPDLGTATKCNYCAHRVDEGREPACVVVCPAEAIIVGDLNEPRSKIARLVAGEDVSVRKPEKGTRPKLFYVEGDAAALQPSGAAIQATTLWGTKAPDALETSASSVGIQATPRGAARRTYDIAQRHTASWGGKVSAYLFTKSIAAGAFLVPAVWSLTGGAPAAVADAFSIGVPLALLFLAITGVLLVSDLKRPDRFHWVLLRPQWSSWLVKGAYIITAYGLFLGAWWLFGPDPGRGLSKALAAGGAILAAGTASYTGWLFAQAKGRDLWQSPLVPLHLLVQAAVAGISGLLVFSPAGGLHALAPALALLLAVDAAFVAQDVWGRHPTADAATAARLMRTGRRGAWLVGGGLIAGRGLPIVLLLSFQSGAVGVLSGFLALLGVAIYEHLWVQAPQRLPLA